MKINIQCECGASLTYSSGVEMTDEPVFKIRPCTNCKVKAEGSAFKRGRDYGHNVCIQETIRTGRTPDPV